ncbi:Protein R03E1.2 [Aphelenchoides avenae]|nr:Protein R03E1.2 [Aphelenchus avenae]
MTSTYMMLILLAGVALTLAADADTQNPDLAEYNVRRKQFNVYAFTSSDYPAIFAIFAGLSIVLAVGVTFIVVGLLTMDPGKDSIIYRMTTTRMKKD